MATPPTLAEYFESERAALSRCGRLVRKRLEADTSVQRIAVDKVEMWAVPRFFDSVDCGRLVTMIDGTARPSTAYEVAYSAGYRTSYSGNLDPFDPLVRKLERRIDDLLGL